MEHVPERLLWCAVLDRALADATDQVGTIGSEAERQRVRAEARRWFRTNGTDFRRACEDAGYDPDVVRRRALQMMGDKPA
jgi:hypothetical protein